jgi:RNA polymerase sigma factor (sigma-70 family)
MTKTDAQLLGRRADASDFRELYDRYAERVHGYHLRRTRDPEAAHDLTAESFARAWTMRRGFRDEIGGTAGPWLFGIARNVLYESVRRGRLERAACVRLGFYDRLDREPARSQPDAAWLEGLDEALEEALAELPEGQRDAVYLRIVEDLDYEAVAGALGTTQRAARVRVSRGLTTLRDHIRRTQEAAQ